MIAALMLAATNTMMRPAIVPPIVSVNQCAPCQIRANPVTIAPVAPIATSASHIDGRSVRLATMNTSVPINRVAVVA